jgi:hypothetical protein
MFTKQMRELERQAEVIEQNKLQLLNDRLKEVRNELCGYKWYGNEDDIDFKDEYQYEYQHLLDEELELMEKIIKIKNKSSEDFPIGFKSVSSKNQLDKLFNNKK